MDNKNKIEFEVIQSDIGTYAAACYAQRIYTEGNNLQELHDNIKTAIERHFPNEASRPIPKNINLILYRHIDAQEPAPKIAAPIAYITDSQ